MDVKVKRSRSPHVKDDRKVKVFTGPLPFEGSRMESVQVQQVRRSCSISNALQFIGCCCVDESGHRFRCNSGNRWWSLLYVFTLHFSWWRNLLLVFLQTQIKSLFQHICYCKCVNPPSGKDMVSYTRASGEGKCNPFVSKWMKMTYPPSSPHPPVPPQALRACSLQKKISDNFGGRECQKGKEKKKERKFADVWKQIKSGVALQLSLIWWRTFLNVSGASPAQWLSGSTETAQRFSRRYGQSSFD